MATDQNAEDDPEDTRDKIGISADLLNFTMPSKPIDMPGHMAAFVVDACLALAKASSTFKALAAEPHGAILFLGVGTATKAGVKVARKRLFETGISDMLSVAADCDMRAAQRSLSDAQNEDGEQARHDRLLTAESHLTAAYSKYSSDIEKHMGRREPNRPTARTEALRRLYVNALATATATASILRELKSANVARWAADARKNFTSFAELTTRLYEADAISLPLAESEFKDSRMTLRRLFSDAGRGGLAYIASGGRIAVPSDGFHFDRALTASGKLERCQKAKEEMGPLCHIDPLFTELEDWWLAH